nr:UDP-N-acetylmuramoyl-tripeptide--D-alanyl-D-alanine ligase [Ipomoea batatas]
MSQLIIHTSLPFPLTRTANPQPPTCSFSSPSLTHKKISQITFSSPQISQLWTASELAEAVNGRILQWGPPGPISTDTRTLKPGQWFLPLVGPNFDANTFISPQLSAQGCAGVIANRVCENWDKGFVQVGGNTRDSLKTLGMYARNRFKGCLIGITGSVGKTTTRAMTALALKPMGSVYQSPGNWNNETGVALSLIGMPWGSGFGVLELGMSGKGEILELARICRPNIRVILNVGAAHLENFASLEDVSVAKGEILREAKMGDVCVLNADDPLVMKLPVPVGIKKVLFGQKMGCDVRLVSSHMIDGGQRVQIVLEKNYEMVEFVVSGAGLHLAQNACAAAAVASFLGVPLAQVGNALSNFTPVGRRSELEVAKNGVKIINDVYNANPVSTRAAIDLLSAIHCEGKKVAILGDMLELGPKEITFHEMVIKHCYEARFDLVALVGRRFEIAAKNFSGSRGLKVLHAMNAQELASEIVGLLNCDDVVLVKGSRGMRMEVIVEAIKCIGENTVGNPK